MLIRGLPRYSIAMTFPHDDYPFFDGSAAYQITVQGRIVSSWSDRLEGMAINYLVLDDGTTFTILTGNLTDQAALSGVLNTIYELHFPLIAVHKLPIAGTKSSGTSAEDWD